VHPLDVGDIDASVEAFQAIARNYGPYHGIFHSAGAGLVRPARLTKQEHFQAVLAASVGGTFAIARFASMKNMLHDRSSVVFMSSVAGHRGQAGMALYSASKGAIDAATRSLACELAPRAIRVNSIVAGAVTTEMHERMTTSMPPEAVAEYEAKHLLGFGTPSDVASVVAYLLSDAARWITGSAWVVDGGYLAQ
jgi:NAD(P)-dependent dehydrogenase (short-subunit alcohol dehydrogenase family)